MFLLVSCFSCDGFQVQQETKNNRWVCRRCNQRQSVKKVHYHSHSAAECRKVLTKITYQVASKDDQKKTVPWYLLTDCVISPSDRTSHSTDMRDFQPIGTNFNVDQDGPLQTHYLDRSVYDSECNSAILRGKYAFCTGKRMEREWCEEHEDEVPQPKRVALNPTLHLFSSHSGHSPADTDADHDLGYRGPVQMDRQVAVSREAPQNGNDDSINHCVSLSSSHSNKSNEVSATKVSAPDVENVWQADAWDNL